MSKEELHRTNIQRFISLKNALQTVEAFAIPSLNPEQSKHFEEIKKELLDNYGKGVTEEDLKEYKY